MAGRCLSYIYIDAKNVALMTDGPIKAALEKCKPGAENFDHHVPETPLISLLLSFGRKSTQEKHVDISQLTSTELTSGKPIQIKIVARDISAKTYPFLQDKPELINLRHQLQENTLDLLRGCRDDPPTHTVLDSLPFHHRDQQRSFRVNSIEEEEEWQGIPDG